MVCLMTIFFLIVDQLKANQKQQTDIWTSDVHINCIKEGCDAMQNDTYNEAILIESPGAVIRVYRPDLTDEERNRRMKAIQKASADLLKEIERKKSQ